MNSEKIVYVDSSVFIGILCHEPGSSVSEKALTAADKIVSSILTEAEVYSVAVRERLDWGIVSSIYSGVSLIFPDRSLENELTRVLSCGYVRGADAFHLACALYLDPCAKEIIFLTADRAQAACARTLGFRIRLPEFHPNKRS